MRRRVDRGRAIRYLMLMDEDRRPHLGPSALHLQRGARRSANRADAAIAPPPAAVGRSAKRSSEPNRS